MKNYKILGAEFGLGAKINSTSKGPKATLDLLPQALANKFELLAQEKFTGGKGKENLPAVTAFCKKLATMVKLTVANDKFPIVVGGDHSIAIGTWSALISGLSAYQNFGLLWVDAHLDAHTYETSPSKAYHGMPLACLLGYGEPELVNLIDSVPKLNPQHVVVFGARSFEKEEHDLLQKLGVKIFYAEEIHAHGLVKCLNQAYDIISKAYNGYGITIDLDFFDPEFAPGVGSPTPQGFNPEEFIAAIDILKTDKLKGLEITELNPDLDMDKKTVLLAIKLMQNFLN